MAATMNTDLKNLVSFYLTGKRAGDELLELDSADLRPALLNSYRDLTKLRYDFPAVLIEAGDQLFVRSLTSIINTALQELAPKGIAGEQLRKDALSVEQEMRTLVANGTDLKLSKLFEVAEKNVIDAKGGEEALVKNLSLLKHSLGVDGRLIDCGETTPVELLTHGWSLATARLTEQVNKYLGGLMRGLTGILEADFMKSDEARSAEFLTDAVAGGFKDSFDFDALSGLLTGAAPKSGLSEQQRNRITSTLAVLAEQKFYAKPDQETYSFAFESCTSALEAYESRLADAVELVKSISIAELEIENLYVEAKHDAYYAAFDTDTLTPADLSWFPTYLICLDGDDLDGAEKAKLIDLLSSPLPMKILVRTNNIIGNNDRLAGMAMGLGKAFVAQSTTSNLNQLAEEISSGLEYRGAALFSLFSGSAESSLLAPYMLSASALQSRAFPTFTYDPSAGGDWASRFSLIDNPQVEQDWPVQSIFYQDAELQGHSTEVAFTYLDFAACDARYSDHFALVSKEKWSDAMVPARDFLALNGDGTEGKVPYLLMIDGDNTLQKVVVDIKLIRAAAECTQTWHNIQELGGINNSHAQRLLASQKELWEEEKEAELQELRAQLEQEAPAPAAEAAAAAPAEGEEEAVEAPKGPIEEACIDTARCTTCNECTELNGLLFLYNDNNQAVIGDLEKGTYKQMVEAAEACKVAIIHPGLPWNEDEADLDELKARAEPFN